jgi:hypothetical protein
MELKLQIKGLEKVQAQLRQLSGDQLRKAAADALNDAAFAVRGQMQKEIRTKFDRPTPYIEKSIQVEKARADRLAAWVEPTYMGGKGVDPQKILRAQFEGGPRRDKRSEVALRRVGILPGGYITVIPKKPFPGSDDGRGNLRGPFLVQLISYFQAFGEQGYRANMTTKRRSKLANYGRTEDGYKTINGVVYFVSYGQLRGTHLAPGIWAKSGIHGSDVKPVVMFVRAGTYRARLSLDTILRDSKAQEVFERRMRFRIRQAFEQGRG